LNGFILLSHVGTAPERTDKFHLLLEDLIVELKALGYHFSRIDDLLTDTSDVSWNRQRPELTVWVPGSPDTGRFCGGPSEVADRQSPLGILHSVKPEHRRHRRAERC
jgi:hypothetical protein